MGIPLMKHLVERQKRWLRWRDPSGQISGQFGVQGVPTSMILDASGIIRFIEVGYTTEVGLRLRLWWVDV